MLFYSQNHPRTSNGPSLFGIKRVSVKVNLSLTEHFVNNSFNNWKIPIKQVGLNSNLTVNPIVNLTQQ